VTLFGLGIALIVLGVLALVVGHLVRGAPAGAVSLGWALVVIGVVLIVVSLVTDDGVAAAAAGGTIRRRRRRGRGLKRPQPVLLAFLVGAIPLVLGFVTQVVDALPDASVPQWIRVALVGLGTLTTGLAALWARMQVTPLADPRSRSGARLVVREADRPSSTSASSSSLPVPPPGPAPEAVRDTMRDARRRSSDPPASPPAGPGRSDAGEDA
jgi:hypothetical protein